MWQQNLHSHFFSQLFFALIYPAKQPIWLILGFVLSLTFRINMWLKKVCNTCRYLSVSILVAVVWIGLETMLQLHELWRQSQQTGKSPFHIFKHHLKNSVGLWAQAKNIAGLVWTCVCIHVSPSETGFSSSRDSCLPASIMSHLPPHIHSLCLWECGRMCAFVHVCVRAKV